jgi:hypothetical protein
MLQPTSASARSNPEPAAQEGSRSYLQSDQILLKGLGARELPPIRIADGTILKVNLHALISCTIGVPSENGPDRTLRLTQRPEFAFTEFRGVAPLVVAGEIDVLPAKRGKMLSERRVWSMPVFA